ncbi:MAG: hypothetical protein F4029_05230 [Gammaproteobacteria bacterium]|nr:hypothetical protein [Gammaproteobacteria bacterium]MYK45611.1 hypothetical protein [Gammaproteobacteria bacterium]
MTLPEKPRWQRYPLLDSRIVEGVQNAELALGTVEKHDGNPLFGGTSPPGEQVLAKSEPLTTSVSDADVQWLDDSAQDASRLNTPRLELALQDATLYSFSVGVE